MKQTVKKNDYELYTFKIPLSLRGKKRKAFITKELEKNHPCFSQQCCFDSKVQLKNGKFQSIVAVMDKVKLLEYRGKSKSGVKLEGIKNFDFFSDDNASFVFLIIGFIAILFLFLVAPKINVKNKSVVQDISNIRSDEIVEFPSVKFKIDSYDILEKYLLKVAEHGGIIKNFSYSINQISLEDVETGFSFDVKNIYPENMELSETDFPDSIVQNFSAISYENESPKFSMSLSCTGEEDLSTEKIALETMSVVRNELNKKTEIISEDFNESSFVFSVNDEIFCDLFSALGDCLKNNSLGIVSLELNPGNNLHTVSIVLSKVKEDKKNLSYLLADFWNLFCERKTEPIVIIEKNEKTDLRVEQKIEPPIEEKNYGEKIGEVLRKDGKQIVFYKDADGKIKGVEE